MRAHRPTPRTLLFLVAISTAAAPALVALGQDGDGGDTAVTPPGPRHETGRTEASAVIGTDGGTLEITHSKARVFVPAGLPTGVGRRMTFAESRLRPANDDVAEGFRRLGPAFSFDGAINASSNPILISMRQPRNPARAGMRLVLAMEQPAMCMEGMEPLPGGAAGLCTSWELLEATYDDAEHRVVAQVRSPGGHRFLFGTMPAPEAEPEPAPSGASGGRGSRGGLDGL